MPVLYNQVDLKRILNNCRRAGIRNILALRGDPPIGEEKVRHRSSISLSSFTSFSSVCKKQQWKPVAGGLSNAIDLVRLIREEHGACVVSSSVGLPPSRLACLVHPVHLLSHMTHPIDQSISGDYFCIAVAAYPESHTECWNSPDLPPSEQVRP